MAPFEGYHPSIENDIKFIRATSRILNLSSEATNKIRKTSLLQSIIGFGDLMEVVTEANNRLADMYFSLERILTEKDAISENMENLRIK